MIYTHVHVDLDAAISTAVYCLVHKIPITDEFIRFVPAGETDFPEGDAAILIDMQKNKHTDDSCLNQFAEYLPRKVVAEVNESDSGKRSSHLGFIFASLALAKLTDIQLVQWWEPVVKGWFLMESQHKAAAEFYPKIPQVSIGKYKFLKLENKNITKGISSIASKDGVVGQIYVSGYNMGIVIFQQCKYLSLQKIPKPEGWYLDHRSFMLSWGTEKSPKYQWNPNFKDIETFINYLREMFARCNL